MDPLKQKQNEGYVLPLYLLTETNVKYLHETCKLFSLLNADIISSKRYKYGHKMFIAANIHR